jgi:hypothetical protein
MDKVVSEQPIWVRSEEERKAAIKTYYSSQVTLSNCSICGKEMRCRLISLRFPRRCTSCATRLSVHRGPMSEETKLKRNRKWEETISNKYGSKDNFCKHQSNIAKNNFNKLDSTEKEARALKLRNAFIDKYGVSNPMLIDEIKQRVVNNTDYNKRNDTTKEHIIDKYGSFENYNNIRNSHLRQNNLAKYGVEHTFQLEEVKQKIVETSMQRYGVTNAGGAESTLIKIKNTLRERYNVDNAFQAAEFKKKSRDTCREKYGVDYYTQTSEYQSISKKHYIYDDISFASSWELAFYIYCKDMNYDIKRCTASFDYAIDDEEHKYFPDFIVNNKIYEIKGPQLFSENGKLGCYGNQKDLEKLRIIKENNIELIDKEKIKFYLLYINETYGKEYLKQFKTLS